VTVIVTVLIHVGVLVANKRVSVVACDIRAVREVFGVFDKWYIGFVPIK